APRPRRVPEPRENHPLQSPPPPLHPFLALRPSAAGRAPPLRRRVRPVGKRGVAQVREVIARARCHPERSEGSRARKARDPSSVTAELRSALPTAEGLPLVVGFAPREAGCGLPRLARNALRPTRVAFPLNRS